ncbi:MAG: uracil-DNA glycosylase [Clostridia bacterium]|nr:uracil-DNA glycosylase [Clostridia bacterium]MBR2974056.1 uracil-DNA glycosylase [Clostridia bacterium]
MIGNSWDNILKEEFEKEYFTKLSAFLDEEYASGPVYPPRDEIFSALKYTAYEDVKIVIIGQDPYHEEGQAHGLCFSVKPGVQTPPSLVNMYKELGTDLGCYTPNNGYLTKWAKQGILLLNAVLTVRGGAANSHRKKGWENFTDAVIKKLNEREKPVVFLLWGNNAKEKLAFITNPKHYVLSAAHPSPLSATRGFMGCRHFSKANTILSNENMTPIDWQIENI